MGQKVNPIALRLGINKNWQSSWYANPKEYPDLLHEDLKIRKMIADLPECKGADISEIEIVRHPQRVTIIIHTARPGVIIGVKGANIEVIGSKLQKYVPEKIQIKIREIKHAELNASLIAQGIARQLAARGSFRKAMKQASQNAMKAGCQGIKIRMSGRLGGADMSRTEEHKEGRVPLHTLRADIDYGFAEAQTTYGAIGVKVWVFNGMHYGKTTNNNTLLVKRNDRPRDDRPRDDVPKSEAAGQSAENSDSAEKKVEKKPVRKPRSTKAATAGKDSEKPKRSRAKKADAVKEASDATESKES